jgi:hypothetical protein
MIEIDNDLGLSAWGFITKKYDFTVLTTPKCMEFKKVLLDGSLDICLLNL